MKVHGWAVGGTSSFANGRHDGYFLMMDKLDGGTLTQKIAKWKKQQAMIEHQLPATMSLHGQDPTIIQQGAEISRLSHYIEKLKCGQQMASALAHLHSLRIVFRDLKPGTYLGDPPSHQLPSKCEYIGLIEGRPSPLILLDTFR